MIQIARFYTENTFPFHRENCVVLRKSLINHSLESIEFGFPYYDALPVELKVPQCMDLIYFLDRCFGLKEEESAIWTLKSHGNIEQIIAVRRMSENYFLIDIAFTDFGPIQINLNEAFQFKQVLKSMLQTRYLAAPKEGEN
ncbi:hypothetical protein P4T04_05360 [Bacillus badius]|uniref:hypothetical protein n=1 Tax=Bacillus badius TaxID=1455 RepID=UPI002E209ACD|nr:hypothetical protein [Bacillus badius]